jgi:hypothetical protein
VQQAALSPLAAWENFYVIIGSSAGALTGLMFVVITLGAEARAQRSDVSTFGTPTVVHFCTALLVSAVACAPWPAPSYAGLAFALVGLAGLAYVGIVIRRARRTTGYRPVAEDWLWHAALPLVAYVVLAGAGVRLPVTPTHGAFGVGSAALLLLFIAIHNAWDAITYTAFEHLPRRTAEHTR